METKWRIIYNDKYYTVEKNNDRITYLVDKKQSTIHPKTFLLKELAESTAEHIFNDNKSRKYCSYKTFKKSVTKESQPNTSNSRRDRFVYLNHEFKIGTIIKEKNLNKHKKILIKYGFIKGNEVYKNGQAAQNYITNSVGYKFYDISQIKNQKDLQTFRDNYSGSKKKTNDIEEIKTEKTGILSLSENQLKQIFTDKTKGIAFSDGSSRNSKKGYGIIVIVDGCIYEESGYFTGDPKNSITAELTAAQYAISRAISMGTKHLYLCYDCESIIHSINNSNQSNNDMKLFHEFYERVSTIMKITFIKVKSHSGVVMNERVDKMAAC